MPAGQHRTGFLHLGRTARHDIGKDGRVQTGRKTDDIERRFRLTAHRIDIAERIRGGDLAELIWIVHDRSKEVNGLDHRDLIRHLVDGGVVIGVKSHKQIVIFKFRQLAHNLGKGLRT